MPCQAIRELPSTAPVRVGGDAAAFVDQQAAIAGRLALAIGLLALLTFTVLWLMTDSIVLPLKALVMNTLTVGVALAPLELIYGHGRLTGLLHYTANGGVEPTDFLVTAALVFALSTDYGVFLLGRITEAHRAGAAVREAVVIGVGAPGGCSPPRRSCSRSRSARSPPARSRSSSRSGSPPRSVSCSTRWWCARCWCRR